MADAGEGPGLAGPAPDAGTAGSPCVRICLVHPEERLCVGCFRTLEEIAAWSRLTAGERAAIRAALPARAARLGRRRGGRAARLARGEGGGL